MEKTFNWEYLRMLLVTIFSPILGYFTPTSGFLFALIIAFAFNMWCGMRADGITITCCDNFTFKKLRGAIVVFLIFLAVLLVVFAIMKSCGDEAAGVIMAKSLTYVFCYYYLQNSFKNLIAAYPRIIALRVIYHVVRLEFSRAMPDRWKPIMDRLDNEINAAKERNSQHTKNGTNQ